MSLFQGLLGNASEVDAAAVSDNIQHILLADEKVTHAFAFIRDGLVFTSLRLIFIDQQGLTGKKVAYHSIPYKRITQFSVETAGSLDLDAELVINAQGAQLPLRLKFNKRTNIFDVQKILASYTLT